MVQASDIRERMEVRDSVGVHVGTVDHVEADGIKLTRTDSADGQHHHVPMSAIERVDAHVHLNRTAAALGLSPVGAAGAGTAAAATAGKKSILPWIGAIIGFILLALLFKGCVDDRKQAAVAPAATMTASNGVVGETAGAPQSAALSGLGTYLAGTEAAPRTFTFEQLNFDTARSEVRAADQAEVDQVAGALKQYGTSRVRIAGYADARGSSAANTALGKARADAVKAALVAKGIDAGRIETVSGGETEPVDTNATAPGQAENRRTELVVTAR